jgi:hypothetical protein
MSRPVSRKDRPIGAGFLRRYGFAVLVAIAVSGFFSAISLVIPPSMFSDSGFGFVAWHGTLGGRFNSMVGPDPLDISKDTATFLATWSPGQYLFPGIFTLLGLKLGQAIIVAVAICSISSAIGWLRVLAQVVTVDRPVAIIFVLVLLTARYATLPYGIYDGGEILLQGLIPWLALWSFGLPRHKPSTAFSGAVCFTLIAFVAKLSGLIVVALLVGAAALTFLVRHRKLNGSLIAAGAGVAVAVALSYHFYIAKGWTAINEPVWHLSLTRLVAPFVLPWFASLSLDDAISYIAQNPHHKLWVDIGDNVLIIAPAALLACFLFWRWKPQSEPARSFKVFAGFFIILSGLVFLGLFLHSGIDIEERHFRLAGLLILTCATAWAHERIAAGKIPWPWIFSVMLASLYGLVSFLTHASANAGTREPSSWTAQVSADEGAIRYLQLAYGADRRSSLFVFSSPDEEVVLPHNARTLALAVDFTPLKDLPDLYRGKIGGKIYFMVPDRLAEGAKARRIIGAFVDYHISRRLRFGNTSVFVLSG